MTVTTTFEPARLGGRLSPADEADLRWYVTESEGALGLRSSFGPMVAMLSTGLPQGSASADSAIDAAHRCVESAERERRIRETLRAMPRSQVRVLLLRHVPARASDWPGSATLGVVAGVALVTSAARQGRQKALEGEARTQVEASGGTLTAKAALRQLDRLPEWSLEAWLARVVKRSRDRKNGTPEAELSQLAAIRQEAEALVADAELAYVTAKIAGGRNR